MAVEGLDQAPEPLDPAGSRPNVLDPVTDLYYLVGYLRDLDWFSAPAESSQLLGFTAARTAEASDYSWGILKTLCTSVLSGWQQLTLGLARLWELWIQPGLVRLHNIGVHLYNAASSSFGIGLQGLHYLTESWARPLMTWLGDQWTTLRFLATHLGNLRGVFLTVAGKVDGLSWDLGTTAWSGFEAVRAKVNEGLAWLNHVCHPTGVLREDPWVWAATVFHGDLVAVLAEGLIPETAAADIARVKAALPLMTYEQVLARFRAPASSGDPALRAAIDRARSAL